MSDACAPRSIQLADVLYPYNANTSDWRGNTWHLPYTQTTPMSAPIFMARQPAKFYVSTTYAGRMFLLFNLFTLVPQPTATFAAARGCPLARMNSMCRRWEECLVDHNSAGLANICKRIGNVCQLRGIIGSVGTNGQHNINCGRHTAGIGCCYEHVP